MRPFQSVARNYVTITVLVYFKSYLNRRGKRKRERERMIFEGENKRVTARWLKATLSCRYAVSAVARFNLRSRSRFLIVARNRYTSCEPRSRANRLNDQVIISLGSSAFLLGLLALFSFSPRCWLTRTNLADLSSPSKQYTLIFVRIAVIKPREVDRVPFPVSDHAGVNPHCMNLHFSRYFSFAFNSS